MLARDLPGHQLTLCALSGRADLLGLTADPGGFLLVSSFTEERDPAILQLSADLPRFICPPQRGRVLRLASAAEVADMRHVRAVQLVERLQEAVTVALRLLSSTSPAPNLKKAVLLCLTVGDVNLLASARRTHHVAVFRFHSSPDERDSDLLGVYAWDAGSLVW